MEGCLFKSFEDDLCAGLNAKVSLGIEKLPRISSRRDTPRPSVCMPYAKTRLRKSSFADIWEETFTTGTSTSEDSPDSSSGSSAPAERRKSVGVIGRRRTSDAAREPGSPGGLKPSANWTRMRSMSRQSNIGPSAIKERRGSWRSRSLSTLSLPDTDDLKRTGWRSQSSSPTNTGTSPRSRSSSRTWTPRRMSGVYSKRFADQGPPTSRAADPTLSPSSTMAQYTVEVTGDVSGVANGTYNFTEKNGRKLFTRSEPRKATLAPRQSHGMWFLLAWGEEKNGKQTWTDYCSPHDGELPPRKGWRTCSRTKDKTRWEFGDEVPIRIEIHRKDAYPTYT